MSSREILAITSLAAKANLCEGNVFRDNMFTGVYKTKERGGSEYTVIESHRPEWCNKDQKQEHKIKNIGIFLNQKHISTIPSHLKFCNQSEKCKNCNEITKAFQKRFLCRNPKIMYAWNKKEPSFAFFKTLSANVSIWPEKEQFFLVNITPKQSS